MYETSKAVQRRLHDSNFISRYFRGNGIDIGAGNDPLGQYIELFPLMESCLSYDRADGDAQDMSNVSDGKYDFVHSSHCLEDTHFPPTALKNWFRILKPGGHLVVIVPDEDMYEQGVWPSTFNADHKHSFTIFKGHPWHEKSWNLAELVREIGPDVEVIKIERLTGTFRFGLERQDQTRGPIGESAIELVIRKRPDASTPAVAETKSKIPAILLNRPGAIGDIVMTLSLIDELKNQNPGLDVFYSCNASIGASLQRLMKAAGVSGVLDCTKIDSVTAKFEKMVNLIGYPLHEGYPEKPMARHLIEYFADEMGVTGVSLLHLPHIRMDQGPRPTEMPPRYVTIHPQAGWSHYKNWSHEKWEAVIAKRPDIWFYQIGAATDRKLAGAKHRFMGQDLDASIDLMAHADLHLGIDSWTNHLTNVHWNGKGFTPAIVLWGSTQWQAAGYPRNRNIRMGLSCQPCFREDPKISRMPRGPCINPPGQDYDTPKHACMSGITVDMVLSAIETFTPSK